MTPCPFCHRINEGDLMAANEVAVAFADAFPVTEGHTLVVPRKHLQSLYDLSPDEHADVWSLVAEVRDALARRLGVSAFTIGVNDGVEAGQTIEHAHVHVIPRRAGDLPDPRGGIRWVIPERAAYWKDQADGGG